MKNVPLYRFYAPRLWNALPDNIKAAESVQNLKKHCYFERSLFAYMDQTQLSTDYCKTGNVCV